MAVSQLGFEHPIEHLEIHRRLNQVVLRQTTRGLGTGANGFCEQPLALHVPVVNGRFEQLRRGIHGIEYVTPYNLDVLDPPTTRTPDNET